MPIYKDPKLAHELRVSSYSNLKTEYKSGLSVWYDKMEENRTARWLLIDVGSWFLMLIASLYSFKKWFKVRNWQDLGTLKMPSKKWKLFGLSVLVPWFVYFGLIHIITYNQIRNFYHPHADTIIILYLYLGILSIIATMYFLIVTSIISFLKKERASLWVWNNNKVWGSRVWLIHAILQLLPPAFLFFSSLFYMHLRGGIFLIPASILWMYLVLCWRAQLTQK